MSGAFPNHVVGIVGLPRSGTTLLAAVMSVHSKCHAIFEPWNSKDLTEEELTLGALVAKVPRHKLSPDATVLIVKETTTYLRYVGFLQSLLRDARESGAEVSLLMTVRDPLHVFISEANRRREWWGHSGSYPNQESFERWCERTRLAVSRLMALCATTAPLLVSYERLAAEPAEMVARIDRAVNLDYEDAQSNYELSINKNAVRGDNTIAREARPISTESITLRSSELERLSLNPPPGLNKWLDDMRTFHGEAFRLGVANLDVVAPDVLQRLGA